MPYVRRSTLDDARALAPRLRTADVEEVWASSGRSPLYALTSGYFGSTDPMTIANDDDSPCGMFGVVETQEGAGRVWLLASDDLKNHQRRFLRECRQWIAALHVRYPILYNAVDTRNDLHIRWLRWCGFTFLRRVDNYGHEGRPFYEFARHHGNWREVQGVVSAESREGHRTNPQKQPHKPGSTCSDRSQEIRAE